jgi:hypothetical protein
MSIRNPSITFFITTIGHKTLKNTLRSLYGQLNHGIDKVEVFFDGPNFVEVGPEYFQPEQDLYGNDLSMTVLPENLGFWGHGIRNKFQKTFTTDYIHNSDDDDEFCPGSFHQVRRDLKDNYGKVLIYKIKADGGNIWMDKNIRFGNIGTPSGLIFNRPEIFGEWGSFYGGDYQFYEQVQNNIGKENIIFKDTFIYITKPLTKGYR